MNGDVNMVAVIVIAFMIFALLTILILVGANIQEREGQAYQEGYRKGYRDRTTPRTNGDKIRALTDEELAKKIVVLDLGEAPYCGLDNAKCNKMAEAGEMVPSWMCQQCCIKWLQQEGCKNDIG